MLIDRRVLIKHLERINCDGHLNEVALDKDFSTTAATPDHGLFVFAPAIPDVEKFPKKVGVADLGQLIQFLKSSVADSEKIPLNYVKGEDRQERIELDHRLGGQVSILCINPRTAGTYVQNETAKEVKKFLEGGVSGVLTKSVVDQVIEVAKIASASRVYVDVDGKDAQLVVGDKNGTHGVFDLVLAKSLPTFQLALDITYLVPVLRQIHDFTRSEIILIDGESPAGFREGDYLYAVRYVDEESV